MNRSSRNDFPPSVIDYTVEVSADGTSWEKIAEEVLKRLMDWQKKQVKIAEKAAIRRDRSSERK